VRTPAPASLVGTQYGAVLRACPLGTACIACPDAELPEEDCISGDPFYCYKNAQGKVGQPAHPRRIHTSTSSCGGVRVVALPAALRTATAACATHGVQHRVQEWKRVRMCLPVHSAACWSRGCSIGVCTSMQYSAVGGDGLQCNHLARCGCAAGVVHILHCVHAGNSGSQRLLLS
jgi:hypothetical protein